jgi:diaminopimelate dehydrogenase
MQKINIAISSFGNIGEAIAQVHQFEKEDKDNDIELVGIIRRNAKGRSNEGYPDNIMVVESAGELPERPDVVLCAAPSHCVMNDVEKFLRLGISTVDCFDNHKEINKYLELLKPLAEQNSAVSILGFGWDPGFDSIIRSLAGLVVSGGKTITTFGPGRSMGHTTVVKSIHPDIENAVSITLPGKEPGLQRRLVYIELNDKLSSERVQDTIRRDVLAHSYFNCDDSHVYFVESIAENDTRRHGGMITRVSDSANLELKLHGDNSIMTATAMYNAARAAFRMKEKGNYGCVTAVQIAPLDFIKGQTITERLARIKY